MLGPRVMFQPNVFRFLGDVSHLFAVSFLIYKIHSQRSVRGLSFTSQLLYLMVYATRYFDTLWYTTGTYNTAGKIAWFGALENENPKSSFVPADLLRCLMSLSQISTHDIGLDSIRIEHLAGPCLVLAFFFNYILSPTEVLWSFSIYLEAVAILPQMFLSHKLRDEGTSEDTFVSYLSAMGIYRALYLLNWAPRWTREDYLDPIALCGGLVQTGLYIRFFALYFSR
ncbi:hypothetical protein JCM16303_004415 [Sporobolomyces ruberrimus]